MQNPDGRSMQMNLTGFLNAKNARTFSTELWELLLSAQENIGGIPAKFLEQKKEEIKLRQVCSKITFRTTISSISQP
jgi:PWI domain